MSHIVAPFEVVSKALPETAKVRFVHLYPAIATRHSDTIDAQFLVDGHKVIVSISCASLTELREREKVYLSDQQLAEMAALHLRHILQTGYDATQAELFVGGVDLRSLGRQLRYF
jgi:hypothetical protein